MRKKIVIGNWKMNNDSFETKTLLNKLIKYDFNNTVGPKSISKQELIFKFNPLLKY